MSSRSPRVTRRAEPEGAAGQSGVTKIFHFARFDLAALYNAFGVMPQPVYCTKIASRLVRTYTDRHGLKDLVRELLDIDISKQQQSSDWGAAEPQPGAARLCRLGRAAPAPPARALDARLAREGRTASWRRPASTSCPTGRGSTSGWEAEDIFAHS